MSSQPTVTIYYIQSFHDLIDLISERVKHPIGKEHLAKIARIGHVDNEYLIENYLHSIEFLRPNGQSVIIEVSNGICSGTGVVAHACSIRAGNQGETPLEVERFFAIQRPRVVIEGYKTCAHAVKVENAEFTSSAKQDEGVHMHEGAAGYSGFLNCYIAQIAQREVDKALDKAISALKHLRDNKEPL